MANRYSMTSCIAIAAALTAAAPAQPAQVDAASAAVERFEEAVEQYVTLHRALERHLPPLTVSPDPPRIYRAVEARATAIRQARASARTGDVFARDISDLFRSRIERAFAERGYSAAILFEQLYGEDEDWAIPAVNGTFSWRTAVPTPPCVLAVLPPLPDELQYRFVGPHLALVDIEAHLIVDVLADAITIAQRIHV